MCDCEFIAPAQTFTQFFSSRLHTAGSCSRKTYRSARLGIVNIPEDGDMSERCWSGRW